VTTERFWGIRRSAQEGDEFLMVSKVVGEERRSKKKSLGDIKENSGVRKKGGDINISRWGRG